LVLCIRSEVAEDAAGDGAPLTWKDRVKVIRSRSHVDGLQAAIKDKENCVDHCGFVSKYMMLFTTYTIFLLFLMHDVL